MEGYPNLELRLRKTTGNSQRSTALLFEELFEWMMIAKSGAAQTQREFDEAPTQTVNFLWTENRECLTQGLNRFN